MLTLSRKERQRVVLDVAGERIEIEVVQVVGGTCRLGFTAGPAVRIVRAELLERRAPVGGACDDRR